MIFNYQIKYLKSLMVDNQYSNFSERNPYKGKAILERIGVQIGTDL